MVYRDAEYPRSNRGKNSSELVRDSPDSYLGLPSARDSGIVLLLYLQSPRERFLASSGRTKLVICQPRR